VRYCNETRPLPKEKEEEEAGIAGPKI